MKKSVIAFLTWVSVASSALLADENLVSMDRALQSSENLALSIQKSNDEILKSMNQLDLDADAVRVRIHRAHHVRHP